MKMEQSVLKRRHTTFRRRRITQKKTYNIIGVVEGNLLFSWEGLCKIVIEYVYSKMFLWSLIWVDSLFKVLSMS
jgi:hypothetical protein